MIFRHLYIWMCFLLLKPTPNIFKKIIHFNIFYKNGHMWWTIQKSFWILHNDYILDSNIVQTSLMIDIIQNLSSWLKAKL
jgi:hypothetical protein